jgi:hypothetical protein
MCFLHAKKHMSILYVDCMNFLQIGLYEIFVILFCIHIYIVYFAMYFFSKNSELYGFNNLY